MTARSVVLKIHLWLGAGAAIFLVILGLTGSVTAFENDIDHWLHPSLYYVRVSPQMLPEAELIQTVQQRFAPARVVGVHIFRPPDLAHVMQLNDRSTALVSPYDGHILGRIAGPSTTQKIIGYIHQLHTHLVPDPRSAPKAARIGGVIVQIVGFILCLLVILGVILWWHTKRASIAWKAPWFRICFDAHHAIGIYSALFLLIAAVTGVLVERGDLIMRLTHSPEPLRFPQLQSGVAGGAIPISVDRAEGIALTAIPGTTVTDVQIPPNPKGVFMVILRVPEETSEAAHSYIFIDQYSGKVLHAVNFLTESPGYRVIRFNRSIHTGDVWGKPGHILVSVSSLLLVAMVVTGLVIWLRKLAV
jgi:uncharacterized iron-regulated membrane protein